MRAATGGEGAYATRQDIEIKSLII